MKLKVFIFIIVIVCLAGLAFFLNYAWNLTKGDTERFLKVAGVGTTVLLSLVAIICNLFAAFSIEGVKTKNQEGIEKLKSSLGIGLEFSKLKMASERTGYIELNQAVQNYYHELAMMEQDKFDPSRTALAETKISDAGKHLYILAQEPKKLFFDFWQMCRNINDQAIPVTDNKYNGIWKANAKNLGNLTTNFETIISQKLSDPGNA